MTEQEAQVLAARLRPLPFDERFAPSNPRYEITPQIAEALLIRVARIWLPEASQGKSVKCRHSRSNFFFDASLRGDVVLNFTHMPTSSSLKNDIYENDMYLATGRNVFLSYSPLGKSQRTICFPRNRTPEIYARLKPLCDEWFPFFLRSCWLSGADIEASAHEKAEWMQGFSREELEAWNLTM